MMRMLTTIVGVAASLILLGVSGAMNYLFLSSLGKTPVEAYVLGAASAAADVLKALLPFFIAWGWRAGRYAVAVPGIAVWVFFAGFSLLSAIGFAADNRGTFSHTRESLNAAYESALQDLKVTEAKHGTIPKYRPAAILTEEIERHKQDRRWSSTKSCTDATLPESREYCDGYFKLRAELASGIEAGRIKRQIDGLNAEMDRLRQSGAGQDADPQVSLLSRLFGHAESHLRLTLIIIVAVLVEIGSALGLFLSVNHGAGVGWRAHAEPSLRARSHDELEGGLAETPQAGDVVDFCIDCLWPQDGKGVTLQEVFAAYRAWCSEKGERAVSRSEFDAAFASIAGRVGISQDGRLFQGVALKSSTPGTSKSKAGSVLHTEGAEVRFEP